MTKYPTFWVPESDFVEFRADPNLTFYYLIYSIPEFLLRSTTIYITFLIILISQRIQKIFNCKYFENQRLIF